MYDTPEEMTEKGTTDEDLETILETVHLNYIVKREGGNSVCVCVCVCVCVVRMQTCVPHEHCWMYLKLVWLLIQSYYSSALKETSNTSLLPGLYSSNIRIFLQKRKLVEKWLGWRLQH